MTKNTCSAFPAACLADRQAEQARREITLLQFQIRAVGPRPQPQLALRGSTAAHRAPRPLSSARHAPRPPGHHVRAGRRAWPCRRRTAIRENLPHPFDGRRNPRRQKHAHRTNRLRVAHEHQIRASPRRSSRRSPQKAQPYPIAASQPARRVHDDRRVTLAPSGNRPVGRLRLLDHLVVEGARSRRASRSRAPRWPRAGAR